MRKGAFYPRLAFVNLMRSKQFYLPYLLSCSGTACMFYIVSYLSQSNIVSSVRGSMYLISLMTLGCIIVGLFSIVLMLYANNFVMKRRQKELGLYNILGMEKRHIAHLMFWETLICAVVSIVGGIAAGILLSKLVLLLLLFLAHLPVAFGFEISFSAIGQTATLFALLFVLTLLVNLVRLGRSRPIELLRSESSGEREPRVKWPLLIIGLVTLLGGYYIALTVQNPVEAMLLFFVAVLLVIIGTYCLFTSGSIFVLKSMRRNKGFYYQAKHFTAVSGMLYRMKQNAVGLANICILATMVLVTVSTTVCLYIGLDGVLEGMNPTDIAITQRIAVEGPDAAEIGESPADPNVLLTQVQSDVAATGHSMHDLSYGTSVRAYALYSGNSLLFDPQQTQGTSCVLLLQTAEEYKHLTGRSVSLAPNEVLAFASFGTLPNTFFIEETPFMTAGSLDTFMGYSKAMVSDLETVGLVVADDQTLEAIKALGIRDTTFSTRFNASFNIDGTDEEKMACAQALNANSDYSVSCRQLVAIEFYSMYGGFLFLGIFLGLLFLAATVLIIYYKQISEGYEDRRRFFIMQQVGMSLREVRASINSQVLMVFFLPLLAAAVHIAAAFPMIQKMLALFSLYDIPLFTLCTVATLLAFSAIYALVYSITAKTYYKIVRDHYGTV